MIRTYTILIALIIAIITSKAQEFKQVDWDKIEFEVNSPTSQYYYKPLFERYLAGDSTLTETDYFYVYYGYSCQPTYKPLLDNPYRDQLKEIFAKRSTIVDFEKIVEITKEILATEPFNLRDINALAFALGQLGRSEEAAMEMRKLDMIIQTIKSTGNGLTPQTAWYVIYTENCEDMLAVMNFNVTRKIIVSSSVVYAQVSNMPADLGKNYNGFYFNYAEIYKRKPDYLDGINRPKRQMEFNPKYNPKSDANVLKTNKLR